MPLLAHDSSTDAPIQCLGQGTTQNLTAGSTSSQNGTLFSANTKVIRIAAVAESFYYKIGANPTAVAGSAGTFLPEGAIEYRRIESGHKIAVIRAGSSDATVNVEECV
jgi:hypothetical protein